MSSQSITVDGPCAGQTLAAVLRIMLPGQSWNQVRALVAARRVTIGGEPCLDAARRMKAGDLIDVRAQPARAPRQAEPIVVRHLDEHVVVVEKPAGVSTVRHPSERTWPRQRKELEPTLEDLVPRVLAARPGKRVKGPLPRLRKVHRLDKGTSGLVVFARTVEAERGLGRQFKAHTVTRRYFAVVPGHPAAQTIRTFLVRDRGDGRRGSTTNAKLGKEAITHIEVVERLPGYTLLTCRLETGRTHQIRIHLAELGHPICGEKVYTRKADGTSFADASGAERMALHAAELGFTHPTTGQPLHWTMPMPRDLQALVERLRQGTDRRARHANQVD